MEITRLLDNSWQAISAHFTLRNNVSHTFEQLVAHYSATGRTYHNVHHLTECLNHLALIGDTAQYPFEIEIALWFHDAIYDPAAHDNEEKSADWAVRFLTGNQLSSAVVQRIYSLIMATKSHHAIGVDQQLLVDIDLAILGSSSRRFAEYQQQIRQEYAFVEEALYRQKRAQVLASFFNRARIYQTDCFYQQLENKARQNLKAALSV